MSNITEYKIYDKTVKNIAKIQQLIKTTDWKVFPESKGILKKLSKKINDTIKQ